MWLWGHPLSQSFRALAGDLHTEKSRSHAVEISWKEFKEHAIGAGYEGPSEALSLTIRLLHELYYIRYWGDLETAWNASDEVLAADGLLSTVYIDVEWCAGAFRGVIRHERDALLKFFGGRVKGHRTEDRSLFNLSKRILIEGVLHQALMCFMWPQEAKSQDYWQLVRLGVFGKVEQELWPKEQGNIANSPDDYMQIRDLLVRFGVMTRVSVDEFFVPYMKANSHRRTIDARAVAYNDCPYLHKFTYKGVPEHFFWRLSVSLASTFNDSQIGLNFSAHYQRGMKVFLSFAEEEKESNITVRSTHRRGVEMIKESISMLEAKYPGLRRVKRDNLSKEEIVSLESDQAVQIFISHSSDGHDASEQLMAALLALDSSLKIFTSHTHPNDAKHIPNTRVFMPLMDKRYHRSQRCSNEFADAIAQGCTVVPLVMPSFQFPAGDDGDPNYQTWWPAALKAMEDFPLFINFALQNDLDLVEEKLRIFEQVKADKGNIPPAKLQLEIAKEEYQTHYEQKVEREIYAWTTRILDRWRCSEPPHEKGAVGFERVPCQVYPCVCYLCILVT